VSPRSAWGAAALAVGPAAFAAFVGAPYVIVAGLAVLGLVLVMARVGRRLYGERTEARPPRAFESAARPRRSDRRPAARDLERLETLVSARRGTAAGVHYWLRPLLRDIASFRLERHGGVDLDRPPPDAAGSVAFPVPEPLWDLIRPGRPDPIDRSAAGLSMAELHELVDQLEQL
jgi:hypothetical protein